MANDQIKTLQRSFRVWSRLLAFTMFEKLLVFNIRKFLESIYYITIPRLTEYADVTYSFEPVYFFLPPQLIWNLKLYAYRFKAKKKINFVIINVEPIVKFKLRSSFVARSWNVL